MRQFSFAVLSAILLSAVGVSAHADTLLGLYAGADGIVNTGESNHISADNEVAGSYYMAFEHPVPFLPNAKLRYTQFDQSNSNAKALDAIGYFEVLDNVVSIDVGLGAKRLIASGNDATTMPAVYASAGGKLPFTGLSAKAEVFVGKGMDADFSDANAEIKYNFIENLAIDLGLKAGYRIMTVNIDDSGTSSDYKLQGPYLGLETHF
ncbi:MAG: TIGR04219 family outer membrane beta-barrel protein [Candidatus Saccharibacteria bacterium]|nr:TIGR04219 family outer membrane beta-barrel protein [Moraxellaceae bacterium]